MPNSFEEWIRELEASRIGIPSEFTIPGQFEDKVREAEDRLARARGNRQANRIENAPEGSTFVRDPDTGMASVGTPLAKLRNEQQLMADLYRDELRRREGEPLHLYMPEERVEPAFTPTVPYSGVEDRFIPKEAPILPDPGPSAPNRIAGEDVRNLRDMLSTKIASSFPGRSEKARNELRQIEVEKQKRNISHEEVKRRLHAIDPTLDLEDEMFGDPLTDEPNVLEGPLFSRDKTTVVL